MGRCELVDYAAYFEPGDPPRNGRFVFWRPESSMGPPGKVTVPPEAQPGAGTVRVARMTSRPQPVHGDVPYFTLPVADAWPLLVDCRTRERGHPSCRFWGAAALEALRLIAEGRITPGLTPLGYDAWRITGLQERQEDVDALLAAMPPEAHARATTPTWSTRLLMDDPGYLLGAFFDAMADVLPRSSPAAPVTRVAPYADPAPQNVAHLSLAGTKFATLPPMRVRLSLRLDLAATTGTGVQAVVQIHENAGTGDAPSVMDAEPVWRATPEPGSVDAARQMESLIALRRAARAWAPLERLLDDPQRRGALDLDEEDIDELLGDAVPRLTRAGCAVHWPKDLVRSLTGRTVVTPRLGTVAPASLLSSGQLLDFRWRATLDGDDLTDEDMDRLADAHRAFVRLRDRWVRVDAALVARLKARRLKSGVSPGDALTAALTGSAVLGGERVAVAPVGWLADLQAALTAGGPKQVPAPPGLTAELRHYQQDGLAWLDWLTGSCISGGILADDMGLGKTLQVIALVLRRAQRPELAGPTLVVCPATMLGTWEHQLAQFAPTLPVRRFHGPGRTLDQLPENTVVLTTYATARQSAAVLAGVRWSLVAADEAQAVKNTLTRTAEALRGIPSLARLAITGTPVENSLANLWALLNWSTSGLLGSWPAFRDQYARPIEVQRDQQAAARLNALISPFVLRRRKTDPGIAPELPARIETDEYVPLSREQAVLYEAVTRETLALIREADGISRRGLVLNLLTSLRQICNHPAQFLKQKAPEKIAGRSGKVDLLDSLVDQVIAEGQAALVFSQFTEMLALLSRHLRSRGIAHDVLTGRTPVGQRQRLVERFQAGEFPIFLLSLKAAGSGLTLTRAEHVLQIDQWWNPAVMDQAADRAHRIGQTRPVQIHRLVATGTVEEKVLQLLTAKREVADLVLGEGQLGLTELSNDQLAELVSLQEVR